MNDFADSISNTQYMSKKWLVDQLVKQQLPPNPRILILGGWYGSYLVPMLKEAFDPQHIYFNDVDSRAVKFAEQLHGNTSISYHQFDVATDRYNFTADIVVNTSCEHMASYDIMLECNPHSTFVLQSCDNDNDPGHINTSKTTEEFITKTNLKHVVWSGRQGLGYKNRFMVIGRQI